MLKRVQVDINSMQAPEIPQTYFKIHLMILYYLGIDIIPSKSTIYRIYSVFMIASMCMYTILEFLDMVLNFTDLYKMTFILSYHVTHILGTAKIYLMSATSKVLWENIQKIQSGVFKPQLERGGVKEFILIKEALNLCNKQGKLFYTFVLIIIGARGLYAAFDSGTIMEKFDVNLNQTVSRRQRTLPYVTWFPFDYYESPYYEFVFTYQMTVTIIYGFYIGSADALIGGFLAVIKSQFSILKLSIKNLVERAENQLEIKQKQKGVQIYEKSCVKLPPEIEKIEMLTKNAQESVEFLSAKAAKHHQELVEFCERLENDFCYLLLLQFISSLLIICFQLFQISMTDPSSFSFWSMVCYLFLMLFQILAYCWHGNEIKIVSAQVTDAIFESDWLIMSEKSKKYLLLMMMRSQRPSQFTAGKFTLLSLETYMNIIRGSASYFMFLRQMNNQ